MAAATSVEMLPPWARELVETEPVGRLGLLDGALRPRVLPVTFALVEGAIWSAVDDKPKHVPAEELARVRWLRARPVSAFTVDRYDEDWTNLAWVQLIGDTAVLDVAGHERVLEALAERYPRYRQQSPRGPLLRLTPDRIVWWRAGDPRR